MSTNTKKVKSKLVISNTVITDAVLSISWTTLAFINTWVKAEMTTE